MKRLLTTTFLLTALTLAFTLTVQAAGIGLTIQPIKISHTLEKGRSTSGGISLSNASDEDVKVILKVEDFIPNSGGEGIKFVSRAEGVTTVRDWVEINGGNHEIVLKKNEKTSIPYTITAPADAEPGSHFGVAFFEANKIDTDGQQLKIGTQVGVLIFITVPGDFIQSGELREFTGPSFVQGLPINFKVVFENTGTVHFEPKGEVNVRNLFGKTVARIPVEGQVVLPTGVKEFFVPFAGEGTLFGRYTATLDIVDAQGANISSEKIAFYAFPIVPIIVVILGIAIVYGILRFLQKRINISISIKK